MRKGRESKDPDRSVTSWLPEVDASFRDAIDPDPLVEAMVERLRSSLAGLVALDEYGRPVAWRAVVRVALGPTLSRLRDAETSLALVLHSQQPAAAQAQQAGDQPLDSQAQPAGDQPVHGQVFPVRTSAFDQPPPLDCPPAPGDSRPEPLGLSPRSAPGWP